MPIAACPYCGVYHATMCHRVKSIEYHQNGTVKRVELHPLISVSAGGAQVACNPAVNAAAPNIPQFSVFKYGQSKF